MPVDKEGNSKYLVFATKNGVVKRTSVDEFELIRTNGKIAISLRENDELIAVKETCGDDEILIAGSNGKAVRFHEDQIRPMGRSASGVRGFNTDGGIVVGMATSREGTQLLSVSENGYGKRTPIEDYRMTSRGTKGVKTMNLTDKTGSLVAVRSVNGEEDLMIITSGGVIIRISVSDISLYSRNAQGVKLINVGENEVVSKVAIVEKSEEAATSDVEESDNEEKIDNPEKE